MFKKSSLSGAQMADTHWFRFLRCSKNVSEGSGTTDSKGAKAYCQATDTGLKSLG